MSWKEFLKPSKAKIALALALTIIMVPSVEIDLGIRCVKTPCPSSQTVPPAFGLLTFFGGGFIYQIKYLNLALGIVAVYLFSCFVVELGRKESTHWQPF